ncbi:MAG: ABC transporter ATP-binding protein [Burkholderiaceae bacterium]|jgi:NitT/TauT family transport system ATP-binding protein|nr:ABC transporter ATP-binding protein [Burkholderiaceae bacterium]
MSTSPILRVEELGHSYGRCPSALRILDGIGFEVGRNQIVSLVGPSGCGKTTLLYSIAGLLRPSTGRILFEGVPVAGVPAGLAMVFQDYSRSLYPRMSIDRNVEFPLLANGTKKRGREERVSTCLEAVGLRGHEAKYPWQLSGGMQQRAAIARALACRPDILLMDEPFASVDAQTREDLEDLVLSVRQTFDMTILFITHDIDESVYLSDKVIVLSKSPTCVQDQVEVRFRGARDQIGTRSPAEFGAVRHRS